MLEAAAGPVDALDSTPLAVRAEIDACWPERALPGEAYRAKLEILDRAVHLAPVSTVRFT